MAIHSKLRIITHVVTKVHVILQSLAFLGNVVDTCTNIQQVA
jgi:hypothetical protein